MHISFQLYFRAASGRHIPIKVAESFTSRVRGLMGHEEGTYGYFLAPCKFIHTCFMRFPLDILFLDSENQVVGIKRGIKPFRVVLPVKGTYKALMFPSSLHASAFIKVMDTVTFY